MILTVGSVCEILGRLSKDLTVDHKNLLIATLDDSTIRNALPLISSIHDTANTVHKNTGQMQFSVVINYEEIFERLIEKQDLEWPWRNEIADSLKASEKAIQSLGALVIDAVPVYQNELQKAQSSFDQLFSLAVKAYQ
ncbi:hypothetical protein AWENTII_010904 [Aspergillus wentii]